MQRLRQPAEKERPSTAERDLVTNSGCAVMCRDELARSSRALFCLVGLGGESPCCR